METYRMQFIQVVYPKDKRGSVDDITLDELIRSQKISHFYRPSEKRWVDIFVDPVRGSGQAHGGEGWKRRDTDWEEDSEPKAREEKSTGRLRGVFVRFKKHPPRTTQRAEEWFERRFFALRATDDYGEVARAFALSIRLNPQYQKAYLHRGRAYEALDNLQQAIEDYSAAIVLDPRDGKAHYLRGLAFGRFGMTMEAIADLRRAANLQYGPASRLLASRTELREALQAPGIEGFPQVPGGSHPRHH
jgi:hypothetical protein